MPTYLDSALERVVERVTTTYYGKYRATVADISDPENLCRIRANVPAVFHDQISQWAMPAFPFAGDGHGVVFLPKVGDGVWIEFEAGDLRYPIWSGGWFANGQRPQPQGERVRVIVSDRGHKVVLDDENNTIVVSHAGGPEIRLSSSAIVMTSGNSELKMTRTEISLNRGMVEVTAAGVSLAQGAMKFGA
jgi:Uncharacterized protein conserved in bacteria